MDENIKDDKRHNPEENASFLSNIFFIWTLPIFKQGYRRDLTENDLFKTLQKHNSHKLGNKLEAFWNQELQNDSPSLVRAFWKTFWKEISLYIVVYYACCFVGKISQPLLLMRIMDYYVPNQTKINSSEAYLCAGGIIMFSFIEQIGMHYYRLGLQNVGMQMRVAICSLIYRKTLKLSKSSLNKTSTGQIITLMSSDVAMFNYMVLEFCFLFSTPSELIAASALLYYFLGPTSLLGVGFLVLFVPIQMFCSKLSAMFSLRISKRSDERITLMNEIISGIKVIKMYAWEKPFSGLVDAARKLEVKQIRNTTYLSSISGSYSMFMNRIAIFISLATYVFTGNTPVAKYVFVLTSFYNILSRTVSVYLPIAITSVAKVNVSLRRIKTFLELDEVSLKQSKNNDQPAVFLDQIHAKWDHAEQDAPLKNISIKAQLNDTIAIIGPVGSGKSSLLQVILGELSPTSGNLKISGTVSYACQEPWLFEGSIRQNILFGSTFNANKYQEVINACALQRDFSMFPHADLSVVGEKGVMLSGGQKARINLARAIYKDANIYLLDDPLSAVDAQVGKQLFDQCIKAYLAQKCVVLVTHQLQYLENVDRVYVLKDGEVTSPGSYDEIKSDDNGFAKNNILNDMDMEPTVDLVTEEVEKATAPEELKEKMFKGSIKKNVYTTYVKSGGPFIFYSGVFFMFVLTQASATFSDYFITFWVNWEQIKTDNNSTSNGSDYFSNVMWILPYLKPSNCIFFYSALIIFLTCITLVRTTSFLQYCCNISVNLHNKMFTALVKAPVRFFDVNSSGRILNRFSKDIGGIDSQLPYNLVQTLEIAVMMVGVTTILTILNPYVIIPTVILGTLIYFYKHYYMRTSRSLKRIEGITRSPVFSHLTASIQGLTTIRALKTQKLLVEEFDRHQDNNTTATYLFYGCNRAFGLVLDMHCIAYMGVVTLTSIATSNMGGNVGLAITQAVALISQVQLGIINWSEVQNQMTSVERILEYTKLEPEEDCNAAPPTAWPEYGEVEFKSVSLRYSPSDPYILENISFNIPARSKIGIVGRTGAGKSSLITALFKLAPFEGEILIDGTNITKVALQSVRTNLSIIPQDPFLFKGTLRKNLDPFDQYDDKVLWEALDEVELKQLISDSSLGLNYQVSEGGSNFSVGQRQLVCLARAITRSNKILILDEATANVDHATDELIQRTIRRKFRDCTVLTIAHRINTIMDSDKVLVMDAGRVVEYDHPHVLLQKPEGVFYSLVMQTGNGMVDNLLVLNKQTKTT